jgi:hypothetical protein
VFLSNFKPKSAGNSPFFVIFVYFGWLGGLFTSFNSLHRHPLPGTPPPPQLSARQAVYEQPLWSLALSKLRRGASDYGMTASPPLSYWSPRQSYMTHSRMVTYFFTAFWINTLKSQFTEITAQFILNRYGKVLCIRGIINLCPLKN